MYLFSCFSVFCRGIPVREKGLFDLSNKINMASFHIETFHFINLQDNASQRDVCLPCQENIYSIFHSETFYIAG
jgi:hypothetical protein